MDFDGTILQESTVESGTNVIPPIVPLHDYLIFNRWNNTEYTNVTRDVDVGAIYDTTDDATYLWVTIFNVAVILSPTLNIYKPDSGTMTVDWGDGNTTNTSAIGNLVLNHTYVEGDYMIKITFNGLYRINNYQNLFNTSDESRILTKIYFSRYIDIIGGNALFNCRTLKYMVLPSAAVSLGSGSAFDSCASLLHVNIPDGITILNSGSFLSNYSLKSISLPNSITNIAVSALQNCFSLEKLILPINLTTLGGSTIYGMRLIKDIIIPSGVTTVGDNFCRNLVSLKNISLPNSMTSIGTSSFYFAYSLEEIIIPNAITILKSTSFYKCYSLRNITLPTNLVTIEINCFYNCYSLQNITIPSAVTTIGANALDSCCSLEYIKMYPIIPPLITITTFSNTKCPILIPSGTLAAYNAATNWSALSSRFVEY